MKIFQEKIRIQNNIDKWKKLIVDLQSTCQHENVEIKYKSNTGNYDPYADCYWKEFKCTDCGKFWREDQ